MDSDVLKSGKERRCILSVSQSWSPMFFGHIIFGIQRYMVRMFWLTWLKEKYAGGANKEEEKVLASSCPCLGHWCEVLWRELLQLSSAQREGHVTWNHWPSGPLSPDFLSGELIESIYWLNRYSFYTFLLISKSIHKPGKVELGNVIINRIRLFHADVNKDLKLQSHVA